ncbi:MAG: phosphodiester glycosidase family protein [Hyphomicrobiales bacterium]
MRPLHWITFILALACGSTASSAQPAASAAGVCRPLAFGEASYVVCTIDLNRYELKAFLRAADGEPYGSFDRLARSPEGQKLVFAMNGGMYDKDRLPVGLYVESGRTLKLANTASGRGNFHLKPNGVFYAAGETAGVLETSRFLALRPRVDMATQSGPMLVIDGRIHPKFSEESTSRKLRNGVGVRDGHIVVFAISEVPVTFAEFAHLFRDALSCRDALFLDGSVSSLYAPSLHRSDGLAPMGPIIGAVERK